jgi:hypothetical protein
LTAAYHYRDKISQLGALMNVDFPPPQRWQDFEDLTVEVVRAVYSDPGTQGHGRTGQAQAGVDVYCHEFGDGRIIGIQCKRRSSSSQKPGAVVTDLQFRKEVKKAENFKPDLKYFIIATTGSRDTQGQANVRKLNEERKLYNQFPVGIWYWEDFLGFLNSNSALSGWYSNILHALYGDGLADKQILSVLKTAFSRDAFQTPLNMESSNEFRPALEDTSRAVKTGYLLDRITGTLLCRAPGGITKVTRDPNKRCPIISEAVRQLKTVYDVNHANGRIMTNGMLLFINDPDLRNELDGHRITALQELNALLLEHGESPIISPLLPTHP